MRSLVYVLLVLGLIFRPVSAYIDPGTAGMVAGSIWPIILGFFALIGAFFANTFINPIKAGLKSVWLKIRGKKQEEKKESRRKQS